MLDCLSWNSSYMSEDDTEFRLFPDNFLEMKTTALQKTFRAQVYKLEYLSQHYFSKHLNRFLKQTVDKVFTSEN